MNGRGFLRFPNVSHPSIYQGSCHGAHNSFFFIRFANYPNRGLLSTINCQSRATLTQSLHLGYGIISLYNGHTRRFVYRYYTHPYVFRNVFQGYHYLYVRNRTRVKEYHGEVSLRVVSKWRVIYGPMASPRKFMYQVAFVVSAPWHFSWVTI